MVVSDKKKLNSDDGKLRRTRRHDDSVSRLAWFDVLGPRSKREGRKNASSERPSARVTARQLGVATHWLSSASWDLKLETQRVERT